MDANMLCVHGWLPSEGCDDCERDEEIRQRDEEIVKLRKENAWLIELLKQDGRIA